MGDLDVIIAFCEQAANLNMLTSILYDLGFSFFSFHSAERPTPETLTTLKRTPGISPFAFLNKMSTIMIFHFQWKQTLFARIH